MGVGSVVSRRGALCALGSGGCIDARCSGRCGGGGGCGRGLGWGTRPWFGSVRTTT